MKHAKIRIMLGVMIVVLILIGLAFIISYTGFYPKRIFWTKINLTLGRRSIQLFTEQTGRFPESLQELIEYGEKFPDKVDCKGNPREFISDNYPDKSEHDVLDGTGGIYYNPKTGELKINLTKPLKSYWRLYFGERRNEVPSSW